MLYLFTEAQFTGRKLKKNHFFSFSFVLFLQTAAYCNSISLQTKLVTSCTHSASSGGWFKARQMQFARMIKITKNSKYLARKC